MAVFILSGCEYHFQSIMKILPNTIGNESKNRIKIIKIALEEKS